MRRHRGDHLRILYPSLLPGAIPRGLHRHEDTFSPPRSQSAPCLFRSVEKITCHPANLLLHIRQTGEAKWIQSIFVDIEFIGRAENGIHIFTCRIDKTPGSTAPPIRIFALARPHAIENFLWIRALYR